MRVKLGAVILAAAMALSALPALAGTFVFDVTVTGVVPLDFTGCGCDVTRVDSAVLPQTFQVSFQTIGGYDSGLFPPGYGSSATIGISRPTTPLTAELLAIGLIDPSTIGGYLAVAYSGPNNGLQDSVDFGFSAQANGAGSQADYSFGIFGSTTGSPTAYLDLYNDEATDQLLRQIGPLTFGESADYLHDVNGVLALQLADYTGTAVYRPDLSAVPEPAQWMLMIGGFGLAGAALRRRRSAMPHRPARPA